MSLTGPLTSALTGPLTTSLTGVSGPAPILLMPLVNNLNLSIGIGSATFTRSSTGTFLDTGTGLVTTASTNTARFEANGVLIEGASTNLQRSSEEFSNATIWTLDDSVINDNVTVAPDGNTTADRLIDNGLGGTSDVRVLDIHVLANSNDHTFSVFLKTDQLQWAFIQSAEFDTSGNGRSWFNLSSCVLGIVDANHTATIKDFGNGWCRCSITMSSTTDLTGSFSVGLADADGDFVVDKDGTSSIFVWAAQLEELPFASSYIPTVGATVTRSADNLSIPFTGNFSEVTGSIAVTACTLGVPSSDLVILNVNDGGFSNRHLIRATSGALVNYVISDGGSTQVSANIDTFTQNVPFRVVTTYLVNDVNMYFDGAFKIQDTLAVMPTGMTTFAIGNQLSGSVFFGHITNLKTFDLVLTPDEVADI